jgi:hypothetical protein
LLDEQLARRNFYHDATLAFVALFAFVAATLLAILSFLYVRRERVMAVHAHALTPTVQTLPPTEPVQEDMDAGVSRAWGGLLQELQLAHLQLARMRQVVEVVNAAGDKKRKKEDDSDEGATHPPRRPQERSSLDRILRMQASGPPASHTPAPVVTMRRTKTAMKKTTTTI